MHDRTIVDVIRYWSESDRARTATLVRHTAFRDHLERVLRELEHEPPRSVLLIGARGVGRASLADMTCAQLADRDWTVFQASPSQLNAGMMYLGMLEQRVEELLELACGPQHLWRVPDLHEAVFVGRHRFSNVNLLDLIMRDIQAGNIATLATTTPEGFELLKREVETIESVFSCVRIDPVDDRTSVEIAGEWLAKTARKTALPGDVVTEAMSLAKAYVVGQKAPGNVIDLMKHACQRTGKSEQAAARKLTTGDLIDALVERTGLPPDMVDDRQTIDLDDLRGTLGRQVMGQEEAVQCLVERVAMIKAGLVDPDRPAGVFLFAGPTGTGKTELAKALAGWMFGSRERLLRLDMSEFQTYQSLDRLIGTSAEHGGSTLVDEVMREPFSILLLDEFEKSSNHVWDLFLQVFDDARLTDRRGRQADFRNTIIILTSNLGAAVPTGRGIGFGAEAHRFDAGAVESEIGRIFRKEFVNRFDRILVFQPLSKAMQRQILEKELGSAMQRHGLQRRPWVIEWDEQAVDFLLEKGMTPDLGARPLRRAIDRYLMGPLATVIVGRDTPEGDQFLYVGRKGDGLSIQFVDPDASDEKAPVEKRANARTTLRSIMLQPTGAGAEIEFLLARLKDLKATTAAPKWAGTKLSLLTRLKQFGFWEDPSRFAVLAQIETQDRIDAMQRNAASLLDRLSSSGGGRKRRAPPDLVGRCARSLYLLEHAVPEFLAHRTGDAFLSITPESALVSERRDGFIRNLEQMYVRWAEKRGMRLRRLQASTDDAGDWHAPVVFSVVGLGAFPLLIPEIGQHVLEMPGERAKGLERARLGVRVAAQESLPETHDDTALRQIALDRLQADPEDEDAPSGDRVVRRYRRPPSPLVRDEVRGWRTGRLDLVLGGDFDLIEG